MNIYADNGTKVKYVGVNDDQVNWGSCDDPRKDLTEGAEYLVDRTEVHSWHTKVVLQGFEGKYPSVAFEQP